MHKIVNQIYTILVGIMKKFLPADENYLKIWIHCTWREIRWEWTPFKILFVVFSATFFCLKKMFQTLMMIVLTIGNFSILFDRIYNKEVSTMSEICHSTLLFAHIFFTKLTTLHWINFELFPIKYFRWHSTLLVFKRMYFAIFVLSWVKNSFFDWKRFEKFFSPFSFWCFF